ncbi:unnamed protein product [Chondrus crispus]|uniref:Uncharacterized protein n=1 Tax=Chondrus crispus TaxID=2769 RepID=R7QT89_CHOCR|nr:unnamed protein product [Chondrus crispus]CDF41344.1 unnamed protein product [Chondrus crispus]|eukprot:XP_005711638.1 unnamed protein product [Chondrus crispus]
MGKLNVSGPGGTARPPAPPGNSGTTGGKLRKGWGEIISQDLLMQVQTRPHSARVVLGDTAVLEARKGLSRVLQVGSNGDLELFAQQLKSSDNAACEPDFRERNDKIPCFAISYVHSDTPTGRFKFSVEQWDSFKAACEEIFGSGVKEIRIWLDQCLWLRDASQGAWAHTGLMPYVMWPVISLGVKAAGGEKTLDTNERMWPFVEEVAGLWSMGVIITRELRGKTMDTGSRRWLSFQLRHKCEPEESMRLLLLNIFHGAVDGLQTGWQEDVEELKDLAKWNILLETSSIIVGSDWKLRVANLRRRQCYQIIGGLHLSHNIQYLPRPNKYLDKSRRLKSEGSYNGWFEWASGSVEYTETDPLYALVFRVSLSQYQILTDCGEFQILLHGGMGESIRLLVAMDGFTSNFSRGHVAWTQVMFGRSSCDLDDGLTSRNKFVVANVLEEMLGRRLQVTLIINRQSAAIEWV